MRNSLLRAFQGIMVILSSIIISPAFSGSTLKLQIPDDATVDDLEKPNKLAVSSEFFGLHIHHLDVPYQHGKSSWPFIDFGSWRLWGAYVEWKDLEAKEKGEWDFRRLDLYVNKAHDHGIDLLLTLGRTPRWASSRPHELCDGCAAEPASIEDWKDYIRTLARRYKGRIKYYEIWNEPRFNEMEKPPSKGKIGYFSGSAKALVELTKAAKEVLSEEDPAAQIVSPSFVSGDLGVRRLALYLSMGGSKYIDIIGFHYYSDVPEKIPDMSRKIKNLLRMHKIGHLPIWNTESGFTYQRDDLSIMAGNRKGSYEDILPINIGAAYISRSLILAAAEGTERFYWFNWDGEPPHPTMGIASNKGGMATPLTNAYTETRNWLLGAIIGPCESQHKKIFICKIKSNDEKKGWILWVSDENPVTVDLSMFKVDRWHIRKLLGGEEIEQLMISKELEIGPQPIYIYP